MFEGANDKAKCGSYCVNWQALKAIVIFIAAIGAITVGTMVICCIVCTRCMFEMPEPFPSVPREVAFPAQRLFLRDPLYAPF
jgi:hypothetical protein